jgi:hypothetical protein
MKDRCRATRQVQPTDEGKMIRDSFSATKSGSNAPEQEPSSKGQVHQIIGAGREAGLPRLGSPEHEQERRGPVPGHELGYTVIGGAVPGQEEGPNSN